MSSCFLKVASWELREFASASRISSWKAGKPGISHAEGSWTRISGRFEKAARDPARSQTLTADLIIDATGRATRTPLLLERLGFPRPAEQTFTADGIYHSQQIEIPDQDSFPERMILLLPEGKAQRGGLIACENNTWMLTIASRNGYLAHAPTNFADMLTLAQDSSPHGSTPHFTVRNR